MELISDWLEPCLASSAAAAQRVSCESANELLSSLALFILLARLHKLWVETVWLKRRVICVRVDSGGHMMKMNIHTRCEAALMMSLQNVVHNSASVLLIYSLFRRHTAMMLIQRSSRTMRRVMFADKPQPYPAQALCYLDHLMAYAPCRATLLEHNRPALRCVTDCLKNITVCDQFCCGSSAFFINVALLVQS